MIYGNVFSSDDFSNDISSALYSEFTALEN